MDIMSNDPLISVVIPCFNCQRTIRRAIESALAQTTTNIEVLVIDDGSTDGTQSVLRSILDPRLSCYYQPNSGGPAGPRNKGILRSKGQWIAFLDADDAWDPDKLEKCLDVSRAGADFVMHRMRISIDGSSACPDQMPILRTFSARNTSRWASELATSRPAIPPSATMIRRSLLIAHSGFDCDNELIAGEDYELWLRLARSGARFSATSAVLGTYATGADHLTSPARTIRFLPAIARRHFGDGVPWRSPPWLHVSMAAAMWRLEGFRGVARYLLRLFVATPSAKAPLVAAGIFREVLVRAASANSPRS
jgi:glycosyltransferase involved in cell wall biosynthesis